MKPYVKKIGLSSYVVRVKLDGGDMAICECPAAFEANLVRQCLMEAINSRTRSVRLQKMVKTIEADFRLTTPPERHPA